MVYNSVYDIMITFFMHGSFLAPISGVENNAKHPKAKCTCQ